MPASRSAETTEKEAEVQEILAEIRRSLRSLQTGCPHILNLKDVQGIDGRTQLLGSRSAAHTRN